MKSVEIVPSKETRGGPLPPWFAAVLLLASPSVSLLAQQPASVILYLDQTGTSSKSELNGADALARAVSSIPAGGSGSITIAPGHSEAVASDLQIPAEIRLVFSRGAKLRPGNRKTISFSTDTAQ